MINWRCRIFGHKWKYSDIYESIYDEVIVLPNTIIPPQHIQLAYDKKRICLRCHNCEKQLTDMYDNKRHVCWNKCKLDIEDKRDIKLKEILK